jgi:hypothetical protein
VRDPSPARAKTRDHLNVGNWHEGEPEEGAKPVRLCPCSSDVNLFSYGEGIVDFDAEIPDGALDLCVS